MGNLIIGKLYVDHAGIMHVRNMGTGLAARLKFKEQGLIMDRNPHQVPTPLLPYHALSDPPWIRDALLSTCVIRAFLLPDNLKVPVFTIRTFKY